MRGTVPGHVRTAVRRHGGTIAGAALLALLVRRVGGGPFLEGLHAVSAPALLLATAIGVLTTVASAWRWRLAARALGLRLAPAEALGDYYRALFLNAVLPGGVLGDVDRAVRHGRDVGSVAVAARAVVLERAAGQVVLVGSGAAVLLLDPAAPRLPLPAPGPAVAVAVAVAGAGAVAVAVTVAVTLRRRTRCRPGNPVGAARVLRSPVLAAGVLGASVVVLAGHLATFLLAARAAGSAAPVPVLLPLGLLALLAMSLPLNVGGWGPREGVTAWAFAAVGLGAAQGVTTAVVYGLFALVAALPGAAVPLARRAAVRRAGDAAVPGTTGRGAVGRAVAVPRPAAPAPTRPVLALVPSGPAAP